MLFDIGRVAVKIAGRDARKYCVVVDKLDNNYVLVDGETRRKKINVKHLEPLDIVVKIKKNANNEEVINALKEVGISISKRKKVKRSKKK